MEIDKTLDELSSLGIELNLEDDVAVVLGVLIKKLENNKIQLTQTDLIKRILESKCIEDANSKTTPAATKVLPADKVGNPTEASSNYASVVAIFKCLQGHTRPDIMFAVRQCSRYIHQHTNMNITEFNLIGRYILKSSENGIILQPTL